MFQMLAYKKSHMDVIKKLMKREKEAVAMYEDTIIEFGAPTKTVTYNAHVITGKAWRTLNQKYTIKTGFTVPYQQQQNYAESRVVIFLQNDAHDTSRSRGVLVSCSRFSR